MMLIIMLVAMGLTAYSVSKSMPSQMDRMSLSFGVAAKPFGPLKPKPKGKGPDKNRDLMAIAKYAGTGVVGLSGKIAGTVFLNNGVVRVWHKTKTVRNEFTNLVKGTFSGISTAYRTLTASQIAGWRAAASNFFRKNALAETKQLYGAQVFQRVNNILASLGLTRTVNAPGVALPEPIVGLVGVATAGTPSFGLTITNGLITLIVLPANVYARIYATRQVGVSISSFARSKYRLIGIFAPATSMNPLDILSDYVARFGTLVAGQKISFAVEFITRDATANTFAQTGKVYSDLVVGA